MKCLGQQNTISQLYKARWAIESFFKHLKQLFRVKTFVGTSANAVRIQMWCAIKAMLLISYLKNKVKYPLASIQFSLLYTHQFICKNRLVVWAMKNVLDRCECKYIVKYWHFRAEIQAVHWIYQRDYSLIRHRLSRLYCIQITLYIFSGIYYPAVFSGEFMKAIFPFIRNVDINCRQLLMLSQ
jgi:hypothetical protein